MEIAFLIRIDKNFEQLKSLIRYLFKDPYDYFVHMAKKYIKLYQSLKESL